MGASFVTGITPQAWLFQETLASSIPGKSAEAAEFTYEGRASGRYCTLLQEVEGTDCGGFAGAKICEGPFFHSVAS